MKKLSFLFFLTLLSTLTASAAIEINGIYYDLNSETKQATVTYDPYYNNFYTGSVPIPSAITFERVTYTVTSIGYRAFCDCTGLTSVIIPNSVTSIENNAFSGCSGLTSIDIPNSVTSIGDGAFSKCYSLTSVTIPSSVTEIGNSVFFDCKGLTEATFGNGVTSTGSGTFDGCSSLTSVTIPNSVTSIGISTFFGCTDLTEVDIPNSVTEIGKQAFKGSGLTEVTIPNGVTRIEQETFLSCNNLAEIIIPTSVMSIGGWALDETAWFNNQPDGVVYAGNVAYGYKGQMIETSITLKEGTLGIADYAFSGSHISSVKFPNSLTIIGLSAFNRCEMLTSITFPCSLKSIGQEAFNGCSNLNNVYCYAENVPSTGWLTFSSSIIKDDTLHVSAAALDAYKVTEPWSGFGTIVDDLMYFLRGDANGDGEIGMPDVMFVVNYILGNPAETFNADAADANLDGEIGMPDVMFIVNYILNGKFPDE